MQKAFTYSILFHVAIVILALVGIPLGEPLQVEVVDTIEVEISDLTVTTRNKKPPREVEPEKEEPPKPMPAPKPRPKPPEPEPAPKEPEVEDTPAEPAPADEPKEPDVAEPEPEPTPAPPEEKKVAVVTPVAKPRPKPAKKKDDFDSMLNTLELDDKPNDATDKKAKEKDFFDSLDLDSVEEETEPQPREKTQIATILGTKMTVSEVDAVRRQFEKCWNVPIGARNPEELVVEIKVRVRRDRTVLDATIVDTARAASDKFFLAMAESARRAVRNPQCSPLRLPPDKYDVWKEMTVVFDPSAMVGR